MDEYLKNQIITIFKKMSASFGFPLNLDTLSIEQEGQNQLNILKQEMEKILQKSGKTKEELEQFVSNKHNFSQQQWNALQDFKQEISSLKQQLHQAPPSTRKKKMRSLSRKKV